MLQQIKIQEPHKVYSGILIQEDLDLLIHCQLSKSTEEISLLTSMEDKYTKRHTPICVLYQNRQGTTKYTVVCMLLKRVYTVSDFCGYGEGSTFKLLFEKKKHYVPRACITQIMIL